jgi:hypothetical protein
MSKYLVLIYGDEQKWADASPQWGEDNASAHRAFAAKAGAALLDGHELTPSAQAVSLRGSGSGEFHRTDGPFVEAKEGIGGYYLLEASDLEAAVDLAALIPEATASRSGVEVRLIR